MLLKLENVSKIYQIDHNEVYALRCVSLGIKKGEFVAIIGPSGSGKSTIMHILGCLDTPSRGKVIFEGKDVSGLSETQLAKIRNQKVGFVFQTFNLLPRTTALNNVFLPLTYSNLESQKNEKERAEKVLEMVGLKDRMNHFPSQLSGGQQQKVAIARALVNNPLVILADEPTGNLDSKSGEELMKLLKKLNEDGHTIVLVTHDLEIAKYAKRLIKVKDGEIVEAPRPKRPRIPTIMKPSGSRTIAEIQPKPSDSEGEGG